MGGCSRRLLCHARVAFLKQIFQVITACGLWYLRPLFYLYRDKQVGKVLKKGIFVQVSTVSNIFFTPLVFFACIEKDWETETNSTFQLMLKCAKKIAKSVITSSPCL